MTFTMGLALMALGSALPLAAQTPPSAAERAGYTGLHAAAVSGQTALVTEALARGESVDARDGQGRTPLHVAAYFRQHAMIRALVEAGADPNAFENDDYDIVTIAAVANDPATLRLGLKLGASPGNVTSPYQGTALIAAAHLGHAEVVKILIDAGAPLDHVNNLDWTALIEAIVLGDGGPAHIEILRALVEAGANVNLPDGSGATPLALARARSYTEMVRILEQAGAR